VGPVVATFVHALPRSLAAASAAAGTTVDLVVSGEGGGTWHAARDPDATSLGWDLRAGPSLAPACRLTCPVGDAWRLYADYPGVSVAAEGDPTLAAAARGGRAIIT